MGSISGDCSERWDGLSPLPVAYCTSGLTYKEMRAKDFFLLALKFISSQTDHPLVLYYFEDLDLELGFCLCLVLSNLPPTPTTKLSLCPDIVISKCAFHFSGFNWL